MKLKDHRVILNAQKASYPAEAPFGPEGNALYQSVAELIKTAYPASDGNYLGALIKPGDKVVIKPNVVKASHERKEKEWEQVVTHGAVVRAVIDHVLAALKGEGEVIVAEAPQTDTPFNVAMERCGIKAVVDHYQNATPAKVTLLDLRKEEWVAKDGIVVKRTELPGDPLGYKEIDLGDQSAFCEVENSQAPFYGADYDIEKTAEHHSGGRHEYLISNTILECDVLINIPKLKTHKKTGMTCAMKNLVGVNGDKNYLPHYRLGDPVSGGDQFSKHDLKTTSERKLVTIWKKAMYRLPGFVNECFRPVKAFMRLFYGDTKNTVRSGNWYGNDTCWRMVWDLNKAFLTFAKARSYLTIVDAIAAGEGDGPLAPDRKDCGWLAMGEDPQAIDRVLSELMGFDPEKMGFLKRPLEDEAAVPELVFVSEEAKTQILNTPPFEPHFGWKGHIELPKDAKKVL